VRSAASLRAGEPSRACATHEPSADQSHLDEPRRARIASGGGETWHEDWRAEAACVGENLDIFFPLGDQATHHALSNQAKQVCARCPVLATCRAWALRTSPEFGIFGGLTAHERRLVREGRWNGHGPRRKERDDTAA
jgi:WhiB family transcriptional regulator, redox-sensing transcriptional regulator